MARVRSAAAVLPALLPGLLVAVLGFQAGGFFPDAWAPVTLVLALALALRLVTVERPFGGVSGWSGVALAALALLGVWVLLSASWSDAPGRAVIEFARLLLYGLVLALCASAAHRERRLAWAVRGVAVAIGAVCIAGLITRLRPDIWSETGYNAARLDFPITYWNGMGILAGVGAILALHLSASRREPGADRRLHVLLHAVAGRDRRRGRRPGRLPARRLLAGDAGRAAGDRAAGGGRGLEGLRGRAAGLARVRGGGGPCRGPRDADHAGALRGRGGRPARRGTGDRPVDGARAQPGAAADGRARGRGGRRRRDRGDHGGR